MTNEKDNPVLLNITEFHEGRDSRTYDKNHIDTYFFFNDVLAFINWVTEGKVKADLEFEMKRIKRSKARTPSFRILINGLNVTVLPKENVIIVRQLGIHYICQHAFDIFPSEVKHRLFYAIEKKKSKYIGWLYPLSGEPIIVKSHDIQRGFLQTRETNDRYNDDFVEFIRACRKLEVQEVAKKMVDAIDGKKN